MRATALVFLACTLAATPAMATSWITGSFRTAGGKLVQRGESMVEVLRDAGEPMDRRTISTGISIGPIAGLTREQWAYRGSDGIYVLTFVGSRVQQIEVIPDR